MWYLVALFWKLLDFLSWLLPLFDLILSVRGEKKEKATIHEPVQKQERGVFIFWSAFPAGEAARLHRD